MCYLSLITDLYSHKIVGWAVGPTLETVYPLEALKMAYKSIDEETAKGNCSLKQIKGLLKLIPYDELQEHEKQPFISALVNAGKDYSQISSALLSWGASTEELERIKVSEKESEDRVTEKNNEIESIRKTR